MRSNIIDYNVVLVILIGAGMLATVSNTTVVMKSVRPCKAPQAIFFGRGAYSCAQQRLREHLGTSQLTQDMKKY